MLDLKIGQVLTFDDNIDYAVIEKIIFNNKTFVLFSNVDSPEDIVIRQLINNNNELFLGGVTDEAEFLNLIELFNEKMNIS